MAKYLSNRQKNLKVGIVSYTESNTVLEVTGKVGIGTTNATTDLDVNGNIRLRGILYDKDNQPGTAGQILVSTGSGIDWANGAPASAISGITIREEGTIVGGANSVTELNFVGNIVSAASTAGIATITFSDYIANSGVATYATSAGIATNLKGGLVGNIPYQSAADTTVFLANGSSGTILQSNGVGNAPSWVAAAPAGAITGLTVRDEGTIVGGTNSVSQLNFVGSNISVASTAGIATVTIADNLVGTALSISGISTVGFITATNIWNAGITTSSRITLDGANSTTTGGGQIYLNGATGNRIDFNNNGVAAPAFTTRSAGTKLVLFPAVSASAVDYGFGIESSTLWYSIPDTLSTRQHRWYAGTTQLADLKGSGELVIGSTSLTGTASQRLQVTGGAYVSGNLGVGVTNPIAPLEVAQDTTGVHDLTITNLNTGNNITKASRIRFRLTDSVGTKKDVAYITAYTYNLDSSAGNYLSFFTRTLDSNPTEKMRLDNNGNLVLGSSFTATGTASQPLQVTGGAYVSGNLGIGVTNPSQKFEVSGTSRFFTSGQGDVTITHSNFVSTIRGASTVQLALGANNSEAIRINTSGSVGIGTTNPAATLQVKDALAFETTNTTTTNTNQVAVDTFATATFRSAKYQVQVTCPGQISTLGGITTGGRGYTAGTYNVTFTTSSGTGSAAQGTLVVSNGTVGSLSVVSGGTGYAAGDVLTASGGSGLQVSVGSTAAVTGAILTLGAITSAGIGYTAGVGVGTTTLTFLGGTGSGATGLATVFDGVITSSTLLQQPTTGTGGTVFYSGSNYSTASVLSVTRSDLTNTITTITGSVGVSTFTSLTTHGLFVNDIIKSSSTSNGLTAGTNYYVVSTPTTTTFTLGTSVGVGTTFTAGTSLSIGFYRDSANAGGQVAYTNAITGVSTNFQASDLMVLQSGTTADFIEYGTVANNDILGTFAADISGANARLLFTPTYPNNNIKVARQAITV